MNWDKLEAYAAAVPGWNPTPWGGEGRCPRCGEALTVKEDDKGDPEPACAGTCTRSQIVGAVKKILGLAPSVNGAVPLKRTTVDGWEEPVPLLAVVLPPFPLALLPQGIADMVEATAEATQTPPDLAGMLSLSVLATALQKRVEALIREGWREVVSLWTVSALPPGERKSPAYAPIVGPLAEYEVALVRDMAPEIAAAETEREIAQGALKRTKDLAIRAKNTFDREALTREAARLAEAAQRLRPRVSPRLIADDATPERLGMLLAEHGGRMAVLSPEGDVFDMMAGRYSNGTANIGLYLRGHSGDDVIIDRVGRPAIAVRRAAISFGLTVQPDTLLGLTSNPTFRGRGLLGRFLYALPVSRLGHRTVRPKPIAASARQAYNERLCCCLDWPAALSTEGEPEPHLLRFAAEADDAVAEFERWIEPRLPMGAELGSMAGWSGKLAGQTVRLATLFHCWSVANTSEPWTRAVQADSVGRAVGIAQYLIPHARAAFQAMGTDPTINGAREIIEWLKKEGATSFTKREGFNALRSVFNRATEMDESLAILMEHGYIRQIVEERSKAVGRPASPSFAVYPGLRK